MTTTLTTTAPEIFEVFFYTSPADESFLDMLFNKGNKDYHRMFDYTGAVVHVAVRLGAYVYEVRDVGTIKYPWAEEMLDDPRMVGFYTYDLKHIETNKRLAALFTLEQCVGRKLDIGGCLKYLWQAIGFRASHKKLERRAFAAKQDMVNLAPCTYVKDGRKERFHLPYTCATLVNIVLNRLFDYEPSFDGHLAQSAALSLTVFAELGHGSIYDLDEEQWVIEDHD